MRNQMKRAARLFSTLLLVQFLLVMTTAAYAVPGQVCGPDCECGCLAGGVCTCSPDKAVIPAPTQVQSQNQQSYADYSNYYQDQQYFADNGNYYQDSNYYYEDDSCCNPCCECYCCNTPCCCCTRYTRPTCINSYGLMYECCCNGGVWLPDDPPLFRPFMADPRQICESAGWRFDDNALTKNVIDVSYADSLPIYRWCNVGPWCGQLQIELEGALWAVFDPCYESAPLLNADYYVGVPITYAIDRWQFRLRGYHISSHVGDEFLLNHPHFDRRNPSAEYLDFFVSHDLTEEIRLYAGLGWVVEQDPSYKFSRFYSALGAELRLLRLGFYDCKNIIYGCPIFGMHFRGSNDYKNHIDATYVLGYEFGKLSGLYRRLRFFLEYHDGYSCEGQFSKHATNYFSIRATYGF